jgi:predicted phosphoribosyltransferase
MAFRDRQDAGRQLAVALEPYRRERAIVLALPRGGVVVGYEVARHLNKPLDVLVVRKVGAPGHEELAVGAIGPNNVLIWNREVLAHLRVDPARLQERVAQEQDELARRLRAFRDDRPFPGLEGQTVILVDDGLATGATARAAVEAVKAMRPGKVVLAVPVGSRSTVSGLRHDVDALVCLETPDYFEAVSQWYVSFPQNTDQEVIRLLHSAWDEEASRQFS